MMTQVEERLKSLVNTLQKRKVFSDLGIEAPDLSQCGIKCLLEIASLIQERSEENSANVRVIKRFLRKFSEGINR